jgi:hypothetical protein
MEKLLFTLSRVGAGTLSEMLGPDTVNLLAGLDLIKLTASSLAELAVAKFGPEGILLNRDFRHRLFAAMGVTDGKELLTWLGELPAEQPLVDLRKIAFFTELKDDAIDFRVFRLPA